MAVEGNVVQQQLPRWREEIDREMAEYFSALVRMGLPPVQARGMAQEIAQRNAQGAIANAAGAPPALQGPRRQFPNAARVEAIRNAQAMPAGMANAGGAGQLFGGGPDAAAINRARAIQAAQAMPEFIDEPIAPIPLAPGEIKEREEKYAAENRAIPGQFEPPNRLAPIPPEIDRAAALSGQGIGQMRGFLDRAENQSRLAAQEFPQRRADYMNPYIQDVVDKIREEGLRTLNEGVLPSLEAQFIRRGGHGGSKHAGLAQKMARDIQGEILSRQTKARHAGYEQAGQLFGNDQLRKLQHGQDIRNIGSLNQGSNLADITSLMDIGRYKQAHAQHGKENEYYNFMRKKNEPLELLERQGALMRGMPAPVSQYGVNSPAPNPQLNTAGQIGSAAAQLLGMTMRRRGGPIRAKKKRRTR